MRKLLTLIAAMIMCDAYGAEKVAWIVSATNASISNCASGDNIDRPSDPTKTGWRFIGWKEGTMNDLIAINGTSYSPTTSDSSTTWTVTFPYGTITGKSTCSSSSSTISGSGANCWCEIDNRGPLGSLIPLLRWKVYGSIGTTASSCNNGCSRGCANGIATGYGNNSLRRDLFTATN